MHTPKVFARRIYFLTIRDTWMLRNMCLTFTPLRTAGVEVLTKNTIEAALNYREDASLDASCRPLLTWKRVSSDMPYCSNGSCGRQKNRKNPKMQPFTSVMTASTFYSMSITVIGKYNTFMTF